MAQSTTPSRTNSCPAWLAFWSPCEEHAAPSAEFIDNAILGWRWAEKHRHSTPRRNYRVEASRDPYFHWTALETMRGIIRSCDDCRCQTASLAAQRALDDAQKSTGKPTYAGKWRGADNVINGRMMEDPTIRAWYERIAYTYDPSKAA